MPSDPEPYAEVRKRFESTLSRHCGAPAEVFNGHLDKLVEAARREQAKDAARGQHRLFEPPPKSRE